MRDYLVYIPTPDGKYKANIDQNRNFDLILSYWRPNVNWTDTRCDAMGYHPGPMWPTILDWNLGKHKAYCFLCDDVEIDTLTINALFEQGMEHNLDLWQASLTPDSCIGWTHTYTQKTGGFRRTNFVECMMPLFSAEGLWKCKWTFNATESGWGIDYLWSLIIGEEKMGIFDNLTASLHREQTTDTRLQKNGKTGKQECDELLGTLNRRLKSLQKIY